MDKLGEIAGYVSWYGVLLFLLYTALERLL
jgi:hypothetical protein